MTTTRLAASAAALALLLCSGIATAQVSKDGMGKVLPVELFACKFNEGQGPANLDRVITRFNQWADNRGMDNYAAWTLTPHFFTSEQDFDMIWMGAFADGNAMGSGYHNWLREGGEVAEAFNKVWDCAAHILLSSAMYKAPADDETPASGIISMMDCKLNEGHRYPDIKAAELRWVDHLQQNGSTAGYWHWFPTYGGGDSDFDYKVVFAYRDYMELGKDFESFANGGGRETSQEIFGNIDDCDDARVYVATSRRAAQLR